MAKKRKRARERERGRVGLEKKRGREGVREGEWVRVFESTRKMFARRTTPQESITRIERRGLGLWVRG